MFLGGLDSGGGRHLRNEVKSSMPVFYPAHLGVR
jgi:hypothetical protein